MTSGSFLLAFALCSVGGYLVGGRAHSTGGRIGWTIGIAIAVLMLLLMSGHATSLANASAAGVLPSGFFGQFVVLTIAIFAVTYVFSLWIGAHQVAAALAEDVARVEALQPEDFVRELTVLGGHPELANGWFADVWKPMGEDARLAWASSKIVYLRKLRAQGGDDGLAAFGLNLPVQLSALDQNTRATALP